MLAYRVACESEAFAAFAPVSATLVTACPDPGSEAVLAVHSTADPVVRWDGGAGERVLGVVDGMPVEDAVAHWATGAAESGGGDGVAVEAWGDGSRLAVVGGGGHAWDQDVGFDTESFIADAFARLG